MTKGSATNLTLAKIRVSVLATGEKLPAKCWDSNGLSETGQTDLGYVFPRTSLMAAVSHAAELAKAHHDKTTRAAGVYHLFRLPTELEAALHREIQASIPNDFKVYDEIWKELDELPQEDVSANEGPVNMGSLNLSSKKDLARLAYTYKAAFDSDMSCVPYFTIDS